jgi:predicted RecA/RadA family phage recombinase
VFDFPKATGVGTAITAGANVYWDAANTRATTDAAAGVNKLIGKTIKASADADTTVRVRLSQ